MSPTLHKSAVLAASLFAAAPAANARTITLAGEGVTIRYEDRAAALTGAPSLITTSVMGSSTTFLGAQRSEPEAVFSVSSLAQESLPRSFAEGLALEFSIGEHGSRDPGIYSMLLAGAGLFGLIARRRIAALSRMRLSPGFQ